MFGRKKKSDVDEEPTGFFEDEDVDHVDESDDADDTVSEESEGPYDIADIESDDPTAGRNGQRLDLGSVLVPMPPGGQLQVEMAPNGSPQAVHLVTEHGRVTVAAYAAPKSPGQWREVVAELAQSLRDDNSPVSIENGPWGRELVAETAAMDLRFIGVDGPRWMVRCVVAGPSGSTAAGAPLVASARDILRDTVVNRGSEPHPVRTPLPEDAGPIRSCSTSSRTSGWAMRSARRRGRTSGSTKGSPRMPSGCGSSAPGEDRRRTPRATTPGIRT